MTNADTLNKILLSFYFIFAFFLGIGLEKFVTISLILITIFSVIKLRVYNVIEEINRTELNFISFYIIIIAYSILFGDYQYIERQFSFLVFPFLGLHIRRELLGNYFVKLVSVFFSVGLISYPFSIIFYYTITGEITETGYPLSLFNMYEIKRLLFSYNKIYNSLFHNIYYSIYSICSIMLIYYSHNKFHKKYQFFLLILVFIHLFFIVLAASRIAYFIAFLIIVLYVFAKLNSKESKTYHYVLIVILSVSLLLFINKYEYLNYKFIKDLPKAYEFRIKLWMDSLKIFKNNIFGIGFNNFHNELNQLTVRNPLNKDVVFNAHNLYLEYLCSLGLIGGGFFLYTLISVFFEFINKKNHFGLLFLMIMLVSFITEAWLIRQYGIVFFMFFLILCNNFNYEKAV